MLVVEDDPDARLMYSECLTGLGYLVATEVSGEPGVEAALRAPPDAILMDLGMPGMGASRPRSATMAIVKECGCGREYSREEWLALGLCGRIHVPGRNFALELRNCVCGSSIAVRGEEVPGDDASSTANAPGG